jgi:hypothetical protein
MEEYRKPEADFTSSFLAIGEGMDGKVSFARMAAATNVSQEKLQRLARRCFEKGNDIVDLANYHNKMRSEGRPFSWRVFERRFGVIPYIVLFGMKVSDARAYAKTGEFWLPPVDPSAKCNGSSEPDFDVPAKL